LLEKFSSGQLEKVEWVDPPQLHSPEKPAAGALDANRDIRSGAKVIVVQDSTPEPVSGVI
jgi:hypothetical protein